MERWRLSNQCNERDRNCTQCNVVLVQFFISSLNERENVLVYLRNECVCRWALFFYKKKDKCLVMVCHTRMWLGWHQNFFCPRIIICRIESFNFGSSLSDSRSGCLVITKEHYWNCLQIGREGLILLIKENGSWHGDYSPTCYPSLH